MSRKYRLEQERSQQLHQDLQEEEDKLKLQKDRIFGPIIWRRISEGIKIQDLKPDRYEDTLDMIQENYISQDVLFKNTNILRDPLSLKSFREKLLFNMKDRCSIIAVDEVNGILAGVLILKTFKKSDYGCVFSRTQMVEGKCFQSIETFLNYVNRSVDIFEHFKCEIYLRFYLICIKPEYRGKSIGFQLMDTGVMVAKHLGINVIMGIFDCYQLQRLAKNIGMAILYEQEYVKWIDKMGELKFCDPGAGNYSCALMSGETAEETPSKTSEVNQLSGIKGPKAEKRKANHKSEQ